MWIVAIGWAYVVILMAATETSVIAGIMTFFGYCVLPLSILFYLAGAGRRRRRRAEASVRPQQGAADADASMPFFTVPAYAPLADTSGAPSDCDAGADGGCGGGD
ncbi:MAG: hypothetical protein AB1584_12050 [Pseudomonadota bacterium]